MKNLFHITLILITILLFSCKSSFDATRPYGVLCSFTLIDEKQFEAEIVLVDSNYLYALHDGQLSKLEFTQIKKIRARELEHKNREVALYVSAASALALGGALISDDTAVGLISFSCGLGAIAALMTGVPKYRFVPPISKEEIARLKLYARYPKGLSDDQLQLILNFYDDQIDQESALQSFD